MNRGRCTENTEKFRVVERAISGVQIASSDRYQATAWERLFWNIGHDRQKRPVNSISGNGARPALDL
jgi:hypothetical protein